MATPIPHQQIAREWQGFGAWSGSVVRRVSFPGRGCRKGRTTVRGEFWKERFNTWEVERY